MAPDPRPQLRAPLPAELVRPFNHLRSDRDRLEAWHTYEREQWLGAYRHRGLALLALPEDVQREILKRIDAAPPPESKSVF